MGVSSGPRMTLPTQLVLRAMIADPAREMYGLEIGRAAELASGTIHPILARLEGCGWPESRWEDLHRRRRSRAQPGAHAEVADVPAAPWPVRRSRMNDRAGSTSRISRRALVQQARQRAIELARDEGVRISDGVQHAATALSAIGDRARSHYGESARVRALGLECLPDSGYLTYRVAGLRVALDSSRSRRSWLAGAGSRRRGRSATCTGHRADLDHRRHRRAGSASRAGGSSTDRASPCGSRPGTEAEPSAFTLDPEAR